MTISGKNHYIHDKSSSSYIPKHIYTYWHDKNYPTIVSKCIESWKRHCPGYTIHIIHSGNIKEYANFKTTIVPSKAFLSDMIRLHVLSKRGGIWLDASVFLNDSLDWVHGYQIKTNCEFLGYDQNHYISHECVESWFFACIPHSRFVSDWKNEFFRTQSFTKISYYIKDLLSSGINLDHIGDKEYLAVYASAQKIIQTNHMYKLQVIDHHPRMTGIFPLFFQIIKYPVVKYTAGDRWFLEKSGLVHLL